MVAVPLLQGIEQTRRLAEMHFPREFLWGAGLSAYQVEGGNYASEWWRWEQRPGRIRGGADTRVASDHARRFDADVDLARKLGLNALPFAIEWSRVQPQ
ncbi:MAG TPA: glycosyl hydrolase family protein, partial [Candidatus Hydrogenedentes bacterium]|nr:glycosyl hydrolase family protein [Candidatus Hydrogenedentota bacterium]